MTTITALPTPPSRADSTNFSTRGDAFLGALPTFVTEANAVGSEATAAAAAAAASASAAAASQSTASTAAAAVAAQSPVANAAAAAASAAAAAASAAAAAQTSGAVAATTLSASGAVSGAGFSAYLASPPAIGGTTPAAVAATTLSASSTVSGTGFSTYLASPPAIGGTAAAAGAFTTLSASSTVSGTGFSTYLASPPAIGGTAPAAASFTSLNTGQLAGLRNKIINGNMDVWQRGTSFTINNSVVYTTDRMKFESSGVGNTTVSQVAVTPGSQASINTGARYTLSATGVAGLSYFMLSQLVENVNTFESKTITCSVYCTQPASATATAYFRVSQVFGTGGSATVNTDVNVTSTAVGSHYRWTATITIPSISGKTIGTANDYLGIGLIYVPTTFTTNFQFYGLQAELGSVATPFEQRPYGMELALCQRYYQQQLMANGSLGAATVNIAFNTNTLTSLKWQTPMRAAPTVVLYSRNNTANKVSSQASGLDVGTSVTASNTSIFGASPLMDSGAGFTVGTIGYEVFYTASAEL